MKIGFIGIGRMGRHMARHILEAGYDLTVYDIRKEAARHLLEKGANWVNNPMQMAKLCRVIFSCLPGPAEVADTVYGESGLIAGWKKGDIYVDMSTNSPTTIRRVAEDAKNRGVSVLDAPVSGGTPGAEQGTLTIMVGGDMQVLKKVHKLLTTIGSKVFHVGDVGCGNITKLVNNLISGTCNAITAEGFVLGVKAGVDAKVLWQVVTASSGNNWMLEKKYPETVFGGNFDRGFRINLLLKDIGLAIDLGKECNVPLPLGAAVEQRYLEAKAAGLGEKCPEALILRLEELARVQVRENTK